MHTLILIAATATPDPRLTTISPGLADDQIGPGLPGFLAMAFIVFIMFFLIRDMTKRVRRVRYRAQVEDTGGSHGPKSGYVEIPIMTDAAIRAAATAFPEDTFLSSGAIPDLDSSATPEADVDDTGAAQADTATDNENVEKD